MGSRRALLVSALSGCIALSACGGGSDSASVPAPAPSPTPTPPPLSLPPLVADPEVRVSGDSPFTPGCSGSPNGTEYRNAEVEPQVALNPLNPGNLIVSWQQDRWSSGGASGIVTAATFDGGATWTRTAIAVSRCGGGTAANGGDYSRATDPWVTFSPNGVAFQMALSFNGASLQPGSSSAMLVARSADGGSTWSAATPLIVSGSSFFNDKNSITADPTDARYVFAVWDRLALAGGGPSLMARTTDGGTSWEAATVIYNPGSSSQTIGNQVLVLPNGSLLNVFTQIDPGPSNTQVATIQVIRSTDKGASWSAAIKVADLLAIGARDPLTGQAIRDGSIVAEIAVAPNGHVLVVWQDARFSAGAFDGIALSRSIDGGRTWSAPAQINSARTVAAFTPSIRVRADGTIGISYYDLRSNTTDPATLPTELILARSADGVNWSEVRVTPTFDIATAPQAAGAVFLGDYQGLVATDAFIPVYVRTTSSTANRTDVYAVTARSAAAGLSGPRATPLRTEMSLAADDAMRQRVSENIVRVMERRMPGWTRWRTATGAAR